MDCVSVEELCARFPHEGQDFVIYRTILWDQGHRYCQRDLVRTAKGLREDVKTLKRIEGTYTHGHTPFTKAGHG